MSSDLVPIDFVKGFPNPALLPATAITSAAKSALSQEAIATPALLYGADEGLEPVRQAIAEWNSTFYNRKVSKDNIVISGGASQNLACVLQVLTDPLYTRKIWICSPAYMLVFRTFPDNGFADKMRAVPEDEHGIDVHWLEQELASCDSISEGPHANDKLKPDRSYAKYYRHVIYCVPSFSNPSSSVMSLDRRETLVRLAREHDALVIADDVYDHLQWRIAPSVDDPTPLEHAILPRLSDIDAELDGGYDRSGADGFGNAMSNGSFSKITGPGARCGWTEASPKLAFAVSQVGSTHSGGAPSQLVSSFMLELLRSGWLHKHITQTLQPEYARRHRLMRGAILNYLVPLGCSISEPTEVMGGFFIWLKLPPGVDADQVAEAAKVEQNLIIISGSRFEVPSQDRIVHRDHVRLCFSYVNTTLLEEGIGRLGVVLRSTVRRQQQHVRQ